MEVMDRLTGMDPDGGPALTGWKSIREAAPSVWKTIQPILQTITGESVRKELG